MPGIDPLEELVLDDALVLDELLMPELLALLDELALPPVPPLPPVLPPSLPQPARARRVAVEPTMNKVSTRMEVVLPR
jgi:hypothetical protein